MAHKTKVHAEDGSQVITVTRDFDLPLELLFLAHTEPAIVEQWMGTKVLKLESKKHGGYQFETTDAQGNVLFRANGVIHEFIPNQRITRTFEMENTPLGVQLEFYEFQHLADGVSRLNMHVVYESVAQRAQVLKMGLVQGLNMAHDRLQSVVIKLR